MPIRSLLALALLAAMAARAEELTVDQIIDRHVAARGGAEKIRNVRTLVFSGGTYREGDFVGSGGAFMAFARPYYRVVGNPESPQVSIMEGYDGSTWEYYADPGVVLRTVGHASGATRRGAYIDWRLGELRTHGNEVRLAGEEGIGGRRAYRLTVTSRDGFARDFFIDKENFLLLADRYHAPVHAQGESVSTEGRFSDWRAVDGILFAFKVYEIDLATGRELNSMTWGRIDINRELPRSWFSPPQLNRTRLQTVLEQLYMQRTDPAAVLWTYTDFRETYPDVDTRAGVEAIGYHMLKMGDQKGAAALLEANARDHPNAASSAFALGRAYEAAGESAKAKAEYTRALGLDPNHKGAAAALRALP